MQISMFYYVLKALRSTGEFFRWEIQWYVFVHFSKTAGYGFTYAYLDLSDLSSDKNRPSFKGGILNALKTNPHFGIWIRLGVWCAFDACCGRRPSNDANVCALSCSTAPIGFEWDLHGRMISVRSLPGPGVRSGGRLCQRVGWGAARQAASRPCPVQAGSRVESGPRVQDPQGEDTTCHGRKKSRWGYI